MVGQIPNVGTMYNNVCLNEEFIGQSLSNLNAQIDEEL
jgi:hypothetical protein